MNQQPAADDQPPRAANAKDSAVADGRQKWMLLVLAVLAAPALAIPGVLGWQALSTQPLFDHLDPDTVARITISKQAEGHHSRPLVLEKGPDGWIIRSAANAPADSRKIAAVLGQLADLRGPAADSSDADIQTSRLEVHLADRNGRELAAAAFRDTLASRLPSGPAIIAPTLPALPDWPSGWTTLEPPKIAVGRIVAVEAIGERQPPVRLPPEAVAQTVAILLSLSPQGFTGSNQVDWSGATSLRVLLDDGATIRLDQVPDGGGRYLLRLSGDRGTRHDLGSAYAFRVERPLPQPHSAAS